MPTEVTVGQLVLEAVGPRHLCECGHDTFDHIGFSRSCEADDRCQCMRYAEAVR